MAAKLTRLTHKIAIQLHLVAESCNICSSRSRRPVRKFLDTLPYNSDREIQVSDAARYFRGRFFLAHLLLTRNVPGSNLGPVASYSKPFHGLPQHLEENAWIMPFFFKKKKRHLQSFADLWPKLMGFSIYI
jgi:hypothetical protein